MTGRTYQDDTNEQRGLLNKSLPTFAEAYGMQARPTKRKSQYDPDWAPFGSVPKCRSVEDMIKDEMRRKAVEAEKKLQAQARELDQLAEARREEERYLMKLYPTTRGLCEARKWRERDRETEALEYAAEKREEARLKRQATREIERERKMFEKRKELDREKDKYERKRQKEIEEQKIAEAAQGKRPLLWSDVYTDSSSDGSDLCVRAPPPTKKSKMLHRSML